MELLHLLRLLTDAPGPSGLEDDVAALLAEIWQPYVDVVQRDLVGNLTAVRRGVGPEPRPRLLLTAHMDEIALVVTKIEAFNGYGFLRVSQVGGVDLRQLLGQRVVVHGRRNLPGVLGALPESLWPEERQGKAVGFDDLLVDVGCSAEQVRALVRVGDFVTFRRPLLELVNGRVAAKALDNRACLAALTVALELLQQRRHAWDIVVAATVQEEHLLLGGATTGFAQRPDLAVVLDVAFANQPGVSENNAFDLGSGPILDIGVHVHPGVLQALRDTAVALEIPVNLLTHARASGTETGVIQIARSGAPTGLVSIPIRYMHTMVELADLKDIARAGRLVAEFAARLDDQFLPHLTKALIAP